MGAFSDVLGGIKKILLIEEQVSRLDRDVQNLAQDVRRTKQYAEGIDGRVKRIEGFLDGVAAATGQTLRLPKD